MTDLDILYEDNHLLVVNKPAGIATMGAAAGETVHSLAAHYLKEKYRKPGQVYVGVVSRLDAMTSGVLVLARTSKAASRLTPQFGATDQAKKKTAAGRAVKIYLAVVEGKLASPHGRLLDYVRKDDAAHRMSVVDDAAQGAQLADLEYLKVAETDDVTIAAVRLKTGRKHQIRLQLAEQGHAIIGDRKYGSQRKFAAGIALHSWCLQVTHPTRQESLAWYADLPASWKRFAKVIPAHSELKTRVEQQFDLDLSGEH